jgi:TPR repeat protein
MRKVLLVGSIGLLAAAALAFVHHRTAAPGSARQALVTQATQGSPEAQYKLGALYVIGEGEPQNDTEAAQWFRKAAEQGHVDAQSSLALMYAGGLGVPYDLTEAAKWYREAADHGDAEAQAALAALYYQGRGVPQSKVSAYQWAKISTANPTLAPDDRSTVEEVLNTLTAALTPAEIAEAEKRAQQWAARAGDGSQTTQ